MNSKLTTEAPLAAALVTLVVAIAMCVLVPTITSLECGSITLVTFMGLAMIEFAATEIIQHMSRRYANNSWQGVTAMERIIAPFIRPNWSASREYGSWYSVRQFIHQDRTGTGGASVAVH